MKKKRVIPILSIIFITVLFIISLASSILAVELYLFGGKDSKVFLGCLTGGKYDSDSIWNKYGDYGSRYSDKSIWNRYGDYGSKYSDYSPWARYGSNAPAIIDEDWNFYGYFSVNPYHKKRTELQFCIFLLKNYDYIVDNFDDVADMIDEL